MKKIHKTKATYISKITLQMSGNTSSTNSMVPEPKGSSPYLQQPTTGP
jgi:hypothetical protein